MDLVELTGSIIGGPGKTVEIDETLLCKRKYNRGRINSSNCQWLVGGACRETKEIFLKREANRKDYNVAAGTRIITDCWGGYNQLANVGFLHDTVNHSTHFVNPEDSNVHTQMVENFWRWLKDYLKKKGTNRAVNLNFYLAEYVFRRTYKNAFAALLVGIALD
uniref:DDE_Tnp_IS1595 domain-containing protein n=1 Tax=Anopheles dirus TaxID=7168 RepID=A0A182NVN4_9DIPT